MMKMKLTLTLLLPSARLSVYPLPKLLLPPKLFRPKLHRRHQLLPVLQPLPKLNQATTITSPPNRKYSKSPPVPKLMRLTLLPKLVPKIILLARRIIHLQNLITPMAAVMMKKKMISIQQTKLIPKLKMRWPS